MTVRELGPGETHLAAAALLELRPRHGDADGLVRRIDEVQRAEGYRLVASFADEEAAAAAAGFRILENLAWGRTLYVDDLVTRESARGAGHADALFAWLGDAAREASCDEFHLDSGVGPEREAAHRFYFTHRLRITAFHFMRRV